MPERRIDGRSMNYIGTPLTTSAEDSLVLRVDTIDSICEARERERERNRRVLLFLRVLFVEHPEAGRSSINFPGNLGNLRGLGPEGERDAMERRQGSGEEGKGG